MTTLLEKLRAATGGDREIDALIAWAFDGFWVEHHRGENVYCRTAEDGTKLIPGQSALQLVPHYTADLSAVVALVESKGFTWAMDASAPECGCDADLFPKTKSEKQFRWTSPTPALALLCAFVEALGEK